MVDETIKKSVRSYLDALQEQGIPVAFGMIFGSYVTGRANQWSDVDLLVVSPRFDGPRNRDDIFALWRIAARTDSRIEPIACGVKQWEQDNITPIIDIARREGEKISVM